MKSKISCSAKKLSLLEPSMIESVVETTAYKLGAQYLNENRVRIIDSNSVKISSAVLGNSGMHEQVIHLKDGMLISDCSCPLNEAPICRHGVAVLLEYYRWSNPNTHHPKPKKETAKEESSKPAPNGSASSNINLRDLTSFVEWIQIAFSALKDNERLPEPPDVGSREVKTWVSCVQNVEELRREMEVENHKLKTEVSTGETKIQDLTQQLRAANQNYKSAQHVSQTLQRELSQYRVIVEKVTDMANELDRFENQVRGVGGDLAKQRSQLEHLSESVKRASTTLKGFSNDSSS